MGGGRAILGPHAMPMGMYKNRVKIDRCFLVKEFLHFQDKNGNFSNYFSVILYPIFIHRYPNEEGRDFSHRQEFVSLPNCIPRLNFKIIIMIIAPKHIIRKAENDTCD